MLSTTICQTRWYSLITLLVLLMIMLGPMNNSSSAGSTDYSMSPAQVTDQQQLVNLGLTEDQTKTKTNIEVTQTIAVTDKEPSQKPTLIERISKIKSAKDLMEKNKILPMLHDDLSQFTSVEVMATGYYAGLESTGKNPEHPEYGITYSGVQVRRDIFSTIAADPEVFPLGTVLYIPGYGYGVVADTGSAIKGKKIDLYYETKDQVFKEWGKRKVNVFVVKQGNGKVKEHTLQQLNAILSAEPTQTLESLL